MSGGRRSNAQRWCRFHAVATAVWAGLVVPTVLWWSSSIRWVGLMMVYTCVFTHLSNWHSARAEVKADGDD